jgi:hypothetical protein
VVGRFRMVDDFKKTIRMLIPSHRFEKAELFAKSLQGINRKIVIHLLKDQIEVSDE